MSASDGSHYGTQKALRATRQEAAVVQRSVTMVTEFASASNAERTSEMSTVTPPDGGREEETVTVRRSESADAQGIDSLISPEAAELFGSVNVLQLLEKANLAVTVANEEDDIVAHASFLDHPVGELVDQADWELFLHQNFSTESCTPLNTLFLHLFVAQPTFATASVKAIMRAVFNAIPELEHICLVGPNVQPLEPALNDTFESLQRLTDPGPQCLALICHRRQHFPRLHIRPARVEDHDDIMRMFKEQTSLLSVFDQPYLLTELIEAQHEDNPTAVCEIGGVTVGFICVTTDVDMQKLRGGFELGDFDALHEPQRSDDEDEPRWTQTSEKQEETRSTGAGRFSEELDAFSIQLFVMDKKYEMRSVDFIPYLFKLFPDLDLCVITAPTLSPEFPLLQSFIRLEPRAAGSLLRELYVFHRVGLRPQLVSVCVHQTVVVPHRPVEVRAAVAADRPAVSDLVKDLALSESLLHDLDCYYASDTDAVRLQAFVAEVDAQVVGTLIIRDEQDMEYVRAHYNIENFIYFSHHGAEEHARIRHFVLRRCVQHFTRHLFKEVLRLAHRSCLYHRVHPAHHRQQEDSCVHHLDFLLNCAVPVRPRRQIIFPLEELGVNAPSRQITEHQAPFALCLISRKLTLEPKVTVNARVVVVGASDTGLSFLEVLCLCPHLRFNNLTLVSTHGFPGDYDHEDGAFLSTSHAYSGRDLARLPLRACVSVVTGKMVGINRKSKHVLASGGAKVPYDHLVLCTGLQYRAPCPRSVDVTRPVSNSELQSRAARRGHAGPVLSNLLTLNDLDDCAAARRWLGANFVKREDNAVVYGNNIDVYATVEALLGLGVRGSRIHVVLPPPEPGAASSSCFSDPVVEEAVASATERADVQVHRNCLLVSMKTGKQPEALRSASFTTDAKPLHLQCAVFINLSNRGVDYDAFKSVNGSFLVFDSRLVIDATFRTSDSAIYGAGPVTKFSRCYHSEEWSHANFNSKEVGQDLAATMLPLFDPTRELADEQPPEEGRLVPLYRRAKVQGAKLPGGFHYLHVTKPSATDTTPTTPAEHDREFVTGRPETGNYFCLHLDGYELVETLTCLSLTPLPISNYLSLYGKHQQLLGQLSSRYREGLIRDLYRFSDFEQEIQQIMSNQQDDESTQRTMTTDDDESRAALRNSAVKYLSYNRNLLPMFACTGRL
ncbi:hypothetical protein F2P81_024592 [Scophthalmus maximus]|uniref:Uncharacterized protein n=1 Tax=Scophthalmus maximus TaxID=52904 RepID=A0A6A4RXX9_SCOMX|nr:hypothetical protein F2P81_024592 [Scophthalmus maximus]